MPKLNKNPYIKYEWRDHIVDIETGEVIQEGTRFTASRINNIEEGIYNSYEWLLLQQDELQKLRIQLEMTGRSPINNGTFFDTLSDEGEKALTLQKEKAIVQHAYETGATSIQLDVAPFAVGTSITIFDDEQQETVEVLAVEGNNISVSPLQNSYKKGAIVSRSNVVIDELEQEMFYGEWGTYQISVSEVI